MNGALLDPTLKYAVAFTIGNSGGATITAGTQKSITVLFTILNQYDGMYSFEAGSRVMRYNNDGSPTGDANMGPLVGVADRALTTIDGNTLTWTPVWASGSGVSGADNFRLYVDPVTNLTTMTALGNPSLRNIPGKPNFYDPATRTFTINLQWATTSGVGDFMNREINVVLKYKGKRP